MKTEPKTYFKWVPFDPKQLRKMTQIQVYDLLVFNQCYVDQEKRRGMNKDVLAGYERSIAVIQNEINRRRDLRQMKSNATRDFYNKLRPNKEKEMNSDSALQLVPPVINKTDEKSDTTKEKSMSTTQRQSKPRTAPEVIAEIQKLRSGANPMSLSGISEKLKISFETVKKYDPLQASNAKPSRAGNEKKAPAKPAAKKEVAKKVEKRVAPKKAVPASLKKVIAEKTKPAQKKEVKAQPKKEDKVVQASSNKSKITMLTSEIKGKLTLLEALVRKEIESK